MLDGNMKNARQVCACKDVGELRFAGMNGTVVVGECQGYQNLCCLICSS